MAKDKPQVIDAEKLPNPDGRPICFVVMPYGRTEEEVVWFCGWYQEVIMSAVEIAGYRAVLAANILEPTAINDEIRSHLIHDPMAVVDLGGFTPQDAPNPNVMYELGIRHAAALPHVLMAWEGQRLPFDVSNQRAIVKKRGLLDFADNRRELTAFNPEMA